MPRKIYFYKLFLGQYRLDIYVLFSIYCTVEYPGNDFKSFSITKLDTVKMYQVYLNVSRSKVTDIGAKNMASTVKYVLNILFFSFQRIHYRRISAVSRTRPRVSMNHESLPENLHKFKDFPLILYRLQVQYSIVCVNLESLTEISADPVSWNLPLVQVSMNTV